MSPRAIANNGLPTNIKNCLMDVEYVLMVRGDLPNSHCFIVSLSLSPLCSVIVVNCVVAKTFIVQMY